MPHAALPTTPPTHSSDPKHPHPHHTSRAGIPMREPVRLAPWGQ